LTFFKNKIEKEKRLLNDKAELLDLHKVKPFREYTLDTARKMRKDSDTIERIMRITGLSESNSMYFLLEHKSRKDKNYYLQIMKNKMILWLFLSRPN
jgi:hypothetical protein